MRRRSRDHIYADAIPGKNLAPEEWEAAVDQLLGRLPRVVPPIEQRSGRPPVNIAHQRALGVLAEVAAASASARLDDFGTTWNNAQQDLTEARALEARNAQARSAHMAELVARYGEAGALRAWNEENYGSTGQAYEYDDRQDAAG